jgi:hypothetical protein
MRNEMRIVALTKLARAMGQRVMDEQIFKPAAPIAGDIGREMGARPSQHAGSTDPDQMDAWRGGCKVQDTSSRSCKPGHPGRPKLSGMKIEETITPLWPAEVFHSVERYL